MRTRSLDLGVGGKYVESTDCLDLPVCTECHRRKQRCTRQWPCHHCQKRKIADQCRFMRPSNDALSNARRRRSFSRDQNALPIPSEREDFNVFKIIGYMNTDVFCSILSTNKMKDDFATEPCLGMAGSCPQLQRALELLHSRITTDMLIQNYLAYFNFHSYVVYPRAFLDQYCDWWANRRANKALALPWTCLLLTVCAFSMQHSQHQLRHRLEIELGEQHETLSDKYHRAALELHDAMSIRDWDISSMQMLMHSCLWYQFKAQFVQAWHTLNIAIRLAQELGIGRKEVASTLSEFDCETHRRLWCLLDNWDWQISSVLSRPLIIDRSACGVDQPSLMLEGYPVPPLLFLKLQSLLISHLSCQFGTIDNPIHPRLIDGYVNLVQEWMDSFPPQLDTHNPDTSLDWMCEWIPLHRSILQCEGYQMMLRPFRPYLTRNMTLQSPQFELQLRAQGVDHGLRSLHSLIALLNRIRPGDVLLQPTLFSLFDVSLTLCSTILHDEDGGLRGSKDIWDAVQESVAVLGRLAHSTWTAQELLKIVTRATHRINVVSEMAWYWSMDEPSNEARLADVEMNVFALE